MALYLIEIPLPHELEARPEPVEPLFERIADAVTAAGAEVIEIQAGRDTGLAYTIAEHKDGSLLEQALTDAGIPHHGSAEVRLVGPSLEQLKAHRSAARYLVEWDLPTGLTLERYLDRKRAKAPVYAQVPETTFLRTYVCLDMSKCLCLYDAPDEAAVLRARAAVDTPVDRLTQLEPGAIRVRA
ncbi:MAG: DUF4242 domain-containing protein [Chloroflexota bacterium]